MGFILVLKNSSDKAYQRPSEGKNLPICSKLNWFSGRQIVMAHGKRIRVCFKIEPNERSHISTSTYKETRKKGSLCLLLRRVRFTVII